MAVGNALIDYVLDQLEDFSASARQMFGGVALYRGDAMFGFGYQDRIYFKVDDRNRDEYLRAGMGALIPTAQNSDSQGIPFLGWM